MNFLNESIVRAGSVYRTIGIVSSLFVAGSLVGYEKKKKVSKHNTFGFQYVSKRPNVSGICETPKVLSISRDVCLGEVSEFSKDGMYNIKIFDGKATVLLFKDNGMYYCTSSLCPHYGYPLQTGVYNQGCVTCPLHAAKFSVETGSLMNGPALNNISSFPVRQENGSIFATIPESLQDINTTPKMCRRDPHNSQVYAIVGGGPAGLAAAETLRQNGFTGRILLFTESPFPPIDRPMLSKFLGSPLSKLLLRPNSFFNDWSIELLTNTKIVKIDEKSKTVVSTAGQEFRYDKLFLAVGSRPKILDVPGIELKNIFYLRDHLDSEKLSEFGQKGMRVVVIGASFVGMEAAAALAKKEATVTVIGRSSVPFKNTLGEKVGTVFANLMKDNSVKFINNCSITGFRGYDGRVNGVELSNGEVLQADAVLVGVGVVLNTDSFLHDLKQDSSDGSLISDAFLRTSDENIFCGGDIASFPYYLTGSNIRIEHWNAALDQGRIAAKNMLGQCVPVKITPFFSTMMYGKSLRFVGSCGSVDEVICEGDLSKYEFVAYYVKNNEIVGVASIGKDPVVIAAAQVLNTPLMPSVNSIRFSHANSQTIIESLKTCCSKKC